MLSISLIRILNKKYAPIALYANPSLLITVSDVGSKIVAVIKLTMAQYIKALSIELRFSLLISPRMINRRKPIKRIIRINVKLRSNITIFCPSVM